MAIVITSSNINGFVNAKAYGAIGNGSHDDTAAIQSALNTGKHVYIPTGNYLVSSTLTVSGTQKISGDGYDSQIRCSITDGSPCLDLDDTDLISIEDLVITNTTNSGAATNFYGIRANGANRWFFKNVQTRHAAIGFYLDSAHIGTMINGWAKYCTQGAYMNAMNACNIDLNIENASKGFVLSTANGSFFRIMSEGDARTQSSTIDSVGGCHFVIYTEDSTTTSISEFSIGASATVSNSTFIINSTASGGTAPLLAINNANGLTFTGKVNKGSFKQYVSTTTNTKNCKFDILGTSNVYPLLPAGSQMNLSAVNVFVNPFFWASFPSLTNVRATSSEETTIKLPWADRSIKVVGTVGQTYCYAYQSLVFASSKPWNITKGRNIGVGIWIYTPSNYTQAMNAAGPYFQVVPNGTGAAAFNSTTTDWVKGDWAFVMAFGSIPSDATTVQINYYCTSLTADANSIAYFGGRLAWVGGRDNAVKILNGDYSHAPTVFGVV